MKDVESEELRILVSRTIEVYNRYRSPEALATLLEFGTNRFTIEFEGTFCHTCGVQDYLDAFIYELEDLDPNMKVKILDTIQTSLQSYRVTYKVKDTFSKSKLDKRTLFREFLNERGLLGEDYVAFNTCTKDVINSQFSQWLYERKQKLE